MASEKSERRDEPSGDPAPQAPGGPAQEPADADRVPHQTAGVIPTLVGGLLDRLGSLARRGRRDD